MILTFAFKDYPDSISFTMLLSVLDICSFRAKNIKIMPRHPYILSQFLRLLPRYEFQSIVNKYKGDYHTKHFKCWDHLASMMIAHIRQEDSLRDIDMTLNAHASKLYHIGIKQCPKSTLADANEHRDYRIYEEFPGAHIALSTVMGVRKCERLFHRANGSCDNAGLAESLSTI